MYLKKVNITLTVGSVVLFCVYVCGGSYMPQYSPGGQRTTCGCGVCSFPFLPCGAQGWN